MSQTASDLIMGGSGPPAAKFPTIGVIVRGQIVDTSVAQQKDFKTGELKFWKDGQPMMQAVITLQTDDRDPTDPDDNGLRRLFVASQAMREAVRDAVVTKGAKALEVGGTLAVQYTGDGVAERGLNPPKQYAAEYAPPSVGVGLLGGTAHDPVSPTTPTQQQQRPTSLLGS